MHLTPVYKRFRTQCGPREIDKDACVCHLYTIRLVIKLYATVTSRLPEGTVIIQVRRFFLFMVRCFESYRENLAAIGGESCSSSQKTVRGSCVQLCQWTHCGKGKVHDAQLTPRQVDIQEWRYIVYLYALLTSALYRSEQKPKDWNKRNYNFTCFCVGLKLGL
jgi:hypothetical protein